MAFDTWGSYFYPETCDPGTKSGTLELDSARVTPREWSEASKWSGPDLCAYEPHPDELVPVFRQIAVKRPGGSQPGP